MSAFLWEAARCQLNENFLSVSVQRIKNRWNVLLEKAIEAKSINGSKRNQDLFLEDIEILRKRESSPQLSSHIRPRKMNFPP